MFYGYTRVSTIEQASEGSSSLNIQRTKVEGAAMANGATLEMCFTDPGVSGSLPLEKRPGGQALLQRLVPGDTVIVAKLDRMFRSAQDALNTVADFRERGVNLIIIDINATDPVTENGTAKLLLTILAGIAEMERERILERTQAGRDAKKAASGFIGGAAPFGYDIAGEGRDAKLIPNNKQQAALTVIREEHGRGTPVRKIANVVWQKAGVRVGKTTVHRIVKEDSQ